MGTCADCLTYGAAAGVDLTAGVPHLVCAGVARSLQEDDAEPPVAVFHLGVAVLLALNRYDAFVADGTVPARVVAP